ncbi:MAG TPA: hypothetical protein GXZ23_03465 [Clostridiales bacterium]|nr:hypothetical protein [Clostridiales bacterium]
MSKQRLIDANVLTDFCRGLRKELHGKYKEYTPVEFNARDNMLLNFEQMVGIQPEIDAKPVVRCKDCKHYNTVGCSQGFGWCENIDRGTSDNFYCANGKQLNKESEDD